MSLSPASTPALDPLSDVLAVLDARATRPQRLEADGDWALAFPLRDRLKFVAVVKGVCWIETLVGGRQRLSAGDVCLIGRTAYTVASNPELPAVDGLSLLDGAGQGSLRLGGEATVMLGGGIALSRASAGVLLDMLPVFAVAPSASVRAASVTAVLALLDTEMTRAEMGAGAVAARLAEVLLVEALRACASGEAPAGWLGALADLRLGRALALVHSDIAEPWTVARLAAEAGMSRSAFSARFTRMVGQPPLAYVRSWRLARARALLDRGEASVGSVAMRVGYASQSAFGHAFRRAFATTPRRAPD
ncbi:AraC family transcriptional regulator [Roseiarcus fermentans]|uniref:AraC family transcriptional regulator n=1 Tax=Roseiarcus fermentans TaxID=1473586 RepID=A0A366ERV8_9HYPH|nr:AraC family transcriptional regulator [Roseiarcus fermentans]RBP05034.1 AraC family transcriptional regulator [Roseiarcus fermentans]